ncbi:MAG: helix-turn-helix transcriptional regulator [Spirochaetales bacterium]|nr:helix-turn-helix transcriptional regulator [Spirochaetales bacterium]
MLINRYAELVFSIAVGKTIKRLRKEKKISQEKLAEAINSHQVYISEIERGLKIPSLPILNEMASAFGMSLTELVSHIEKELTDQNMKIQKP